MDLPNPKPVVFTPEEQRRRSGSILYALLWLVIGYAFIHKIAVPLALKLTPLADSPYAHLDLWFFPAFALAYCLKTGNNTAASFFAGGGIVYGAYEILMTANGAYPGWLGFSKMLSSIPLAGLCVAFLSGPHLKTVARAAWLGALSVTLIKLFLWGMRGW